MIDQYYRETLPQLLQVSPNTAPRPFSRFDRKLFSFNFQELDDVYNDVSGVVAETMVQGAEIMMIKVRFFCYFLLYVGKILETSSDFENVHSVVVPFPVCFQTRRVPGIT